MQSIGQLSPFVTFLLRKKYLYLIEILVFHVIPNFYSEILLGCQLLFTEIQT